MHLDSLVGGQADARLVLQQAVVHVTLDHRHTWRKRVDVVVDLVRIDLGALVSNAKLVW